MESADKVGVMICNRAKLAGSWMIEDDLSNLHIWMVSAKDFLVRNFFFPNSGFHLRFPVIVRVKNTLGMPQFKMVKQIVFVESLPNAG